FLDGCHRRMFVTSERNTKLIQTATYRLFLWGDGGHAAGIMIDVTRRMQKRRDHATVRAHGTN
ncbi:MAG: hypothetical protein DMF91_17385, partial [Acidobacteria bacterium]